MGGQATDQRCKTRLEYVAEMYLYLSRKYWHQNMVGGISALTYCSLLHREVGTRGVPSTDRYTFGN